MKKKKVVNQKKPAKKSVSKKSTQTKKKPGRPNLFTEKLKTEILRYIENGNKYRDACILSGISESTFQTWTKQGRDDTEAGKETAFSVFLAKIEQAKQKYKAWLIQCVNNAVLTDGKLALDLLSRKYVEFRKKDNLKLDVSGNVGITMAEIHAAAEELEGEEE